MKPNPSGIEFIGCRNFPENSLGKAGQEIPITGQAGLGRRVYLLHSKVLEINSCTPVLAGIEVTPEVLNLDIFLKF